MGGLRKLKRNLNAKNVWIAQEVQRKKVELAKEFVKDRIEKDAEFARDVLKAVGENLPEEFKILAEKKLAEENVSEKIEEMKQEYGTVLELPDDKPDKPDGLSFAHLA